MSDETEDEAYAEGEGESMSDALTREQVEHCKDCCCARAWNALGITTFTGLSIPEHIAALSAQLQAQTERAEKAEWEIYRLRDEPERPCKGGGL